MSGTPTGASLILATCAEAVLARVVIELPLSVYVAATRTYLPTSPCVST
jgi:hypothetical protein